MSEFKHPKDIMMEHGRKIIKLLEDDPELDIFGPSETITELSHYEPMPEMPYDPYNDTRRFDRGKYNGQRVMDVIKIDFSYVQWAKDTIFKYLKE